MELNKIYKEEFKNHKKVVKSIDQMIVGLCDLKHTLCNALVSEHQSKMELKLDLYGLNNNYGNVQYWNNELQNVFAKQIEIKNTQIKNYE